MRNHYPKLFLLLHAASDFVLLLLVFLLSGLLRTWIPLGDRFSMRDIVHFFPLAVVYAVVMVLCYAAIGFYTSLHCGGTVREGIRIALTNLLGLALVATLLFVFQFFQFSRLLLAYFYLLTTVAVLIKRKIVDRLATAHERSNNLVTDVLLIGGGSLARRYYNAIVKKIRRPSIWPAIWRKPPTNSCRGIWAGWIACMQS